MLNKVHIARLRSLQDKKNREALGLFVVEGEKVVGELAAQRGFAVIELYVTEETSAALRAHALARLITADEMRRISHFPTPSPVLAVIRLERQALKPAALRTGRTLALDAVQDAGNVGTLIRIADWFGLDRVVLSPDCADFFSQKVINASMGSFARIAVHTEPLAEVLRQISLPILGCDLVGDDIHKVGAFSDCVIVIGSEGRGLSKEVRDCVTQFVTIPRFGQAESLNAATAAAIVCDNLRRMG